MSMSTKYRGFLVLLIVGLLISGCSDSIPASERDRIEVSPLVPTQVTTPDWSAYITNVLEGDSAIDYIFRRLQRNEREERGWKLVSFEIAFRSNVMWPTALSRHALVQLTDSTGTIRELGQSLDLLVCGLSCFEYFYLPTGLTLGTWSYVQIPENATIQTIDIRFLPQSRYFNGDDQNPLYSFSLETGRDSLQSPYTLAPVPDIPLLTQDNVVESLIPGFAHLIFANPRLEPGPYGTDNIDIDVTIENLSTDNIDYRSFQDWGSVEVDDTGTYRRNNSFFLAFDEVEDRIIPPGYTDTLSLTLLRSSENSSQVWYMVGIMQNINTYRERINPALFQVSVALQ